MRALAIGVALLAGAAVAGPIRAPHIRSNGGLSKVFPGAVSNPVLLSFLPAGSWGASDECTGTALTGTKGEALTLTRGSAAFCAKTDGTLVSLATDKPRLGVGGLLIERASTNITVRNTAFDNAAWTKTNVNAISADTQVAPDGTTTAEAATSTVNGGNVEATTAALTGGAAVGSVYVKTTSGTQAVNLILRDTTAAADKCTGGLTATTTWQKVQCVALVTTGNNHTLRIYPGGTAGQGTAVFWGAQIEATADTAGTATSVIVTAGTSVTRSSDAASLATPAALTDSVGCLGVTVSGFTSLSSGAPRVLDFAGSNPIYFGSQTAINGDDGATGASKTGLTNFIGRSVRATAFWGGTYSVSGDNLASAPVAYDGTIISATLSVGSQGGTSDWIDGSLSALIVGKTTGACQ